MKLCIVLLVSTYYILPNCVHFHFLIAHLSAHNITFTEPKHPYKSNDKCKLMNKDNLTLSDRCDTKLLLMVNGTFCDHFHDIHRNSGKTEIMGSSLSSALSGAAQDSPEWVQSSAIFGAAVIASISSAYIRKRKLSPSHPTVSVSELWIYPIKSCRGIKLSESIVDPTGLYLDRKFMVVDGNNRFVSQRKHYQMALIDVEQSKDWSALTVSAPGMDRFTFSIDASMEGPGAAPFEVSVWGTPCQVVEVDAQASAWFAQFFNETGIRLVRMAREFTRRPELCPEGAVAFADGFPFLLASEEGMDEVNRRIAANEGDTISIRNFRPNIVVRGCGTFGEDTWRKISIRGITYNIVKPCARCPLPNNDPDTGIMDKSYRVSTALKEFRTGKLLSIPEEKWKREVFFGQNLDHNAASGIIRVGDVVKVLEKSSPQN
jgi:hypothetical protein